MIMDFFKRYTHSLDVALSSLEITACSGERIDPDAGIKSLNELVGEIQKNDKSMFLVGNGASAAFASHMALDWTKNGHVRTHAFNDCALITALGNDFGYDDAFCAPLSWYASSGDLLVTISSSGDSPNIIKCIEMAREKKLNVVTFSGLKASNASRKLGDLNFFIPGKTYGIVECCHQVLLHIWLDSFMGLEEWNAKDYQNVKLKDKVFR